MSDYPCFKVDGLTLIDEKTIQVSGMRVYLAKGAAPHVESDFIIEGSKDDAIVNAALVGRFKEILGRLTLAGKEPAITNPNVGVAFDESGTPVPDPDIAALDAAAV